MKKISTAKKKTAKLNAEIQQLEAQIADSNKRLSALKEAKTEAENTEIISIIRGADLSVDDIAELISDLTAVKKTPQQSEKQAADTDLKGEEIAI
ncbi:MAG: DUF4315 family protein [Alistipes sp.]|nr:DUF4315 family protein [Alistipes sp.]